MRGRWDGGDTSTIDDTSPPGRLVARLHPHDARHDTSRAAVDLTPLPTNKRSSRSDREHSRNRRGLGNARILGSGPDAIQVILPPPTETNSTISKINNRIGERH
ncbi:hypothetical protein ACIBCR_00860 [Micromonospora echinospora]|uniref:hypothetical protein n=1 Tax=Micromonospora echinospora TaxID=1877 RepID=UPI0037A8B0A8